MIGLPNEKRERDRQTERQTDRKGGGKKKREVEREKKGGGGGNNEERSYEASGKTEWPVAQMKMIFSCFSIMTCC